MKILTLYKIRHISIDPCQAICIHLRNGETVIPSGERYINALTGEVYTPVFDECNNELIGFINN